MSITGAIGNSRSAASYSGAGSVEQRQAPRSRPQDQQVLAGNATPSHIPSGSSILGRQSLEGAGGAIQPPSSRGALQRGQGDHTSLTPTQMEEQRTMLELGQRKGLDSATTVQTGMGALGRYDGVDVKHDGARTTITRDGRPIFNDRVGGGDSYTQTNQLRSAQENLLQDMKDHPPSAKVSPQRMHDAVMRELAPRVLDMPRAPDDFRS
jgi:hypothetical protein